MNAKIAILTLAAALVASKPAPVCRPERCARVLLAAGATSVAVFTLARVL